MGLATVSDISAPRGVSLPRSAVASAGHAAEAMVMVVFAAIGWLLGAFWRVCIISLEYGFRAGAGWPQRETGTDDPEPDV